MAYTLTASTSSVSEGSPLVITLDNTGLPDGSLVPFTITGTGISVNDFINRTSLSGNFLIQSNKSRLVLNLATDFSTEGLETLVLRLTGRSESIAVSVVDTSYDVSANIAEFYITPDQQILYEGSTVVFNIIGINVSVGTVVPYQVLGIQAADLFNVPLTGNVTFAANSSYDVTASVTLPIANDFITEGNETAVVLLQPTFPYTLKLSGTASILDSSLATGVRYTLSPDKTEMFEGANITFNLSGTNAPVGTVLSYEIVPWTNWNQQTVSLLYPVTELNANDFIGLTSLTGTFPALVSSGNPLSNVANITLSIKDDNVFEQPEYFYIYAEDENKNYVSSSIVKVKDSGNNFTDPSAYSGNVIVSFLESAILSANSGGLITKSGKATTSQGQLSSAMVLQGRTTYADEYSDVFYQPFSYVIRTSIPVNDWLLAVKDILHPAGFAIFGEINNETSPSNVPNAGISVIGDTEIYTYSSITMDAIGHEFDSSRTILNIPTGNTTISIPFTVSSVYLPTTPI
jgi:hypothetical protein